MEVGYGFSALKPGRNYGKIKEGTVVFKGSVLVGRVLQELGKTNGVRRFFRMHGTLRQFGQAQRRSQEKDAYESYYKKAC